MAFAGLTTDSSNSNTTATATAAAPAVVPTRFTEAVPLSLSSVAHTSIPLEDGVLDGLKTIIQHTLWSSLSCARAQFGRNFSPVDLSTSPFAWTPQEVVINHTSTSGSSEDEERDKGDEIPLILKKKHGFDHSYQRTALIYLHPVISQSTLSSSSSSSKLSTTTSVTTTNDLLQKDIWTQEPGVLAKITLLYASTEEMTLEELDVASYDDDDNINNNNNNSNNNSNSNNEVLRRKKRSADKISNNNDNDYDDDGKFGDRNNNDDDDVPPPSLPPPKHVVMYRAMIEYKSLLATGNVAAVRAEELSMLSFGGSLVDDDVKLGALASLYDNHGKYVLEILGIRGKKYRLDLMDATLSDGTVPTLPSRGFGNFGSSDSSGGDGGRSCCSNTSSGGVQTPHDPFVKTLCVTVTDHVPTECRNTTIITKNSDNDNNKETKKEDGSDKEEKDASTKKNAHYENNNNDNPSFALTKMKFSLEGDLRVPHLLDVTDLPPPNYYPAQIQKTFLSLRCQQQSQIQNNNGKRSVSSLNTKNDLNLVVGMSSGHRLLLDPSEAGKIYIHGRYVTTWGKDKRIGSSFPALFGMDLHSVLYMHGRIADYDQLMIAYATLWAEILTDARLVTKNIGGRLLSRLITGNDPFVEHDDEDDDDDDDDEDEDEDVITNRISTDISCLESLVMSSSKCDPVGISAKALATQFQYEYGQKGYPCLAHEMDWVKDRLPGRVPVVVPQRLIDVLRRGGYFDVKRTSEEVWCSATFRPAKEGTDEELLVTHTCELLLEAKCTDVQPSSIVFGAIVIDDPVQKKGLVRINRLLRQYHVNQAFLTLDLNEIGAGDSMITDNDDHGDDEKPAVVEDKSGNGSRNVDESKQKEKRTKKLAFLLGLHIAREHPDGNVLIRYMLQHGKML